LRDFPWPLAAASAFLVAAIGPTGALVFFALISLAGGASQVVVTTNLPRYTAARSWG